MKKIANFLIDRRYIVFAIMLVLTILCGVLATTVPINKDRTKYLADDSNMKQGLAIMEAAFPETEEASAIRVMFDDLTAGQIADIRARLEAIPNVSSVDYQAGDEKYNKDRHTLFVVHTDFDYSSDEERAIEKAIAEGFSAYAMVYQNNDLPSTELPFRIIAFALTLAVIILFVMSHSWLDPALFLLTIGIAVVINMGTNAVLPYIDEMTATVGPILQLVLSMDYSIILMSRYRQEKEKNGNKTEAMKTALAGSISSIASSALTTVVGLLALVFLSFRLGPEMGIVLAKGVFVSMLCVFTVLPVMILAMDRWLEKTRKKALRIPMGLMTKISHKARHAMPAIFAVLLIGSFVLQRLTAIHFTENSEDRVAHVFPKDNTVVVLYPNEDEARINSIVSGLETDPRIASMLGYSNTLGREMNAGEMSEAINELGGSVRIDEKIVRMLYFMAAGGAPSAITAAEFMNFIARSVLSDETLNAYIDDSIRENAAYFERFSDREKLTAPMTAGEMADWFGIEQAEIEQLYLYYTLQNGTADSGTMTLPAFVDFVLNTVAADETYGAMFDAETLSSLRQLQAFTDRDAVQTERTVSALSAMLGMEESIVKTVFILHNAGDVSGQTMTAADFSSFLCDHLMKDAVFSAYFDEATEAQVRTLHGLIQLAASKQGLSAEQMAQTLGMDRDAVVRLYALYFAEDPAFQQELTAMRMPLTDFLALLKANASGSQLAQLAQTERLIGLAVSGQQLDAASMAAVLGIGEKELTGLYALYFAEDPAFQQELAAMRMPLTDFLTLLKASASGSQLAQLAQTERLIGLAVSGQQLDAASMAGATGMHAEQVSGIYAAHAAEAMTLPDFLDAAILLAPDNAQLQQLHQLVRLAVSGEASDAAALAAVFGIETAQAHQLFSLALAAQKTVRLADFTDFLVHTVLTNEAYAGSFTPEQAAQLRQMNSMVQLAVSGDSLHAEALAPVFGMETAQAYQLFALVRAGQKTAALADFTDFLVRSVLSSEAYAASFTAAQAAQLQQLNAVAQLAVSGAPLDAGAVARTFGMDNGMTETVFRLYFGADISGKTMSLKTFADFLLSDPWMSSMMDRTSLGQLRQMQSVIHAAAEGTAFTSAELADFLGMEAAQTEQLYTLYLSAHGAVWKLSPRTLVAFAATELLSGYRDLAGYFDEQTAANLMRAHALIEAVVSGKAYSCSEMTALLASLTDGVSENGIEILYLYYGALNGAAPDRKMTIQQLFSYLSEELVSDARFETYFDEQTKSDIRKSEAELNEALAQMKGNGYARLVITSDYPDESEETKAYIAAVKALCEENLSEYYLIGNSVMVSEMDEAFDREYLMITLITAAAIFLVVLFTFRNLIMPLILTLIVQCGVFITVAIIGAYSGAMYYLALLIVQSILMGATIDYGIVFCNFYRENRRTADVTGALRAAYEGSIHTVMTSGSILVLVLAALGIFASSSMISEVCVTLSIGVFIAILLILFVLPGMVACCDKLISRRKK